MALGVALSKCTAEAEFVLMRLTLSLSLSLYEKTFTQFRLFRFFFCNVLLS